jgi:formylglycine-generating enzyme required for sulfatase activity
MGTDQQTADELLALGPPAWAAGELPSEQPAHDVTITAGYWIDRTEVTNAGYRAFVDAGGYTNRTLWSEAGWAWVARQAPGGLPRACGTSAPDHPVACITWFEADAYARWRGGRLPTEAEWEYAARGPESARYPWGDAWEPSRCNVEGSTGTEPVASHPAGASWVGAQDMAGNVMEWVSDWLDAAYYTADLATDPAGPANGRVKVEKGGWWGSNWFVARSAYRHFEDPPTYRDHHIGFRVLSPAGGR